VPRPTCLGFAQAPRHPSDLEAAARVELRHQDPDPTGARTMHKTLLAPALAVPALTTAQAIASEKTDAMAPVYQFIDRFNKGDMKSAVAACAEEHPSSMISLRTSGKARARAKNGRLALTLSQRRKASPMRGLPSVSRGMST